MIYLEILLIGIGLAMDAFAVSICKGLAMKKVDKKQALLMAVFFGGFQAIMPLAGWLLGKGFEQYITSIDHWIAFVLLSFIGGKMLFDVFKDKDEENEKGDSKLKIKELFVLAVATSIDALAVGITFAFLSYPIAESVAIIGIVTFVISLAGVYIGNIFGKRFEKKAQIAGGIILILIGIKILIEHLMT